MNMAQHQWVLQMHGAGAIPDMYPRSGLVELTSSYPSQALEATLAYDPFRPMEMSKRQKRVAESMLGAMRLHGKPVTFTVICNSLGIARSQGNRDALAWLVETQRAAHQYERRWPVYSIPKEEKNE